MESIERAARDHEIRLRNDRIAERARRSRFDGNTHVPFLCECGDLGCGEFVRLTLSEYADARRLGLSLIAPGHDDTAHTLAAAS